MTGRSSRMMRADLVLDRAQLVVGQRPVEREVEAQVVRRHERAGLAGPLPDHVAQRPMEQMRRRCGCASCRRAAPASTTASTVSPTRSRPWSVPRWTIRPPTGFCVSVTVNSSLPPPGFADDALVADLAAALGVERRLVEDELGLARARSAPRTPCPSRTMATTRPSAVVVS